METTNNVKIDMDKTFSKDCGELYRQLSDLGDRARNIITEFAQKHGGNYTFDIEDDDHAWIGEETYATALKVDGNGNILVFNSCQCSEYLHDMNDFDILDLANYINDLQTR